MLIHISLFNSLGIFVVIWISFGHGILAQEVPTSDEESDEWADLFGRRLHNYSDGVEDIVNQYDTVLSSLSHQSQRLEKLESLQNSRRKTIEDHISQMVNSPMARLFSEENFTGESEDYRFDTSTYQGGCHNLKNLTMKVKSVKTFGKCVRLFYGDDCSGWSLSVYPGSDNSENVLNPRLNEVESIGRCLPEEFENAYFRGTGNSDVVKDARDAHKYIPDLTEFNSGGKYNRGINASDTSRFFSVERYTLGPNNRLEYISSNIFAKHVNLSQAYFDIESTHFYRSLEKEEGDVVGYAIPLSIGGPANETYNVFPQSTSSAKAMAILASRAAMHDKSKWSTVFVLNLMYEDYLSTRPYALHYWINFGGSRIEYGRISNR